MRDLPQAGIIANKKITKHLAPFEYRPTLHTPELWKHDTFPLFFTLVVEDFLIKYENVAHATHLLDALRASYPITNDWKASLYCGVTLKWDNTARTCNLSMPGYVESALQKFQHQPPTRPQHASHAWVKPTFGATSQLAMTPDTSSPLPAPAINHLHKIIGSFAYYARAVDVTMLTALGELASKQTVGTSN